jgi:hypothetical protein
MRAFAARVTAMPKTSDRRVVAAGALAGTPPTLIVLIEIVLLGVAGSMLWTLGVNYEGLTGSAASKIHPSTYLLVTAFIGIALRTGDPIGYCVTAARLRPASLLLLICALIMAAHIATRGATGLSGAIDTFVAPALLVILLARADERAMRRMEIALHALMTVNAIWALAEFFTRTVVFPYRFDGEAFPTDLRSAALQGHPLTNATLTCCYLLALLSGGRTLPEKLKPPLVVLQAAALVVCGGRSAMVVAVVLGAVYLLSSAHRVLRAGRVSLPRAALAIFFLTLAPLVVGALVWSGFFDILVGRFEADGGSANARVEMFALFEQLPLRDLVFGPDNALVDSLRRIQGLEWGIENPLVKMVLYQGILVTAIMAIAFTLFMVEIARNGRRGLWLPMLAFLLILQTSESIGGKTTMLSKFALIALCMYRAAPRAPHSIGMVRPSEATIAGSRAREESSMIPMPSNRFQNAQGRPKSSAVSRTSRM